MISIYLICLIISIIIFFFSSKGSKSKKVTLSFLFFVISIILLTVLVSNISDDPLPGSQIVDYETGRVQIRLDSEYQAAEKVIAVEYVREYIIKNSIDVIDINNPSEVTENKEAEYWNIRFEIKQESVPLPPYRSFNVHFDGETYEVPRL